MRITSGNGQKNNLSQSSIKSSNVGIPRDNIIDLKKIQNDRDKSRKKQKIKTSKNYWQLIKNISKPKVPFNYIHSTKKIKEKVVVSEKPQQPTRQREELLDNPPEKIEYNQFQLSGGWYKKIIIFATTCFIIVLPVYLISFYQRASEAKGSVLGISSLAYTRLQDAGSLAANSEYDLAAQNFSKASEDFLAAQQQLNDVGGLVLDIASIVPGQAKSAQYLLSAGEKLSQAGAIVTSLVGSIDSFNVNPLEQSSSSLTEFLDLINNELLPVKNVIDGAADDLENVRISDVPEEFQSGIEKVKTNIPLLRDSFANLSSLTEIMLHMLGQEQPQRFLFVFQNTRELRPTGGFIGSIALVDMYQGRIENLEVPGGGVYDVAGQLKDKIISPKPLWLVNPHWNIQDSNWFVDFPTSARKIIWFYERTGGTTVDGIISLTPAVIEELLDVTGSIDMTDDYGEVIDSGNFVRQAQLWAEIEYDRDENQPKKFIGDLLPKLLDQVFQTDADNLLNVLDVFSRSLRQKDFLMYFSDESVENKVTQLGWDGSVKTSTQDYLYVVNTNIAGGKTDHVVDQLIEHEAAIQPDGSIINTITVTRSHRGSSLDRWEQQANVSYLRFYVPQGSTLLSATGFTWIPSFRYQLPEPDAVIDEDLSSIESGSIIDEQSGTRLTTEFGKTVFGNWLSIEPGEVGQVTIKYQLPFRLDTGGLFDKTDSYSLLIQKQPGSVNNFFSSSVAIPADYNLLWVQPGVEVTNSGVQIISDLTNDIFYGILLQ